MSPYLDLSYTNTNMDVNIYGAAESIWRQIRQIEQILTQQRRGTYRRTVRTETRNRNWRHFKAVHKILLY